MKKLRVFVLAALVLALLAGSAFATDYTWTGKASSPSDQTKWELAANWSPSTGYPRTAADTATFTGSATVGIAGVDAITNKAAEILVGNITVSGANSSVEVRLGSDAILRLNSALITVASGSSLSFLGSGLIALDVAPQLTPSASSTILFDAVIATTANVPTIVNPMPQRSRIAFGSNCVINPSGLRNPVTNLPEGSQKEKWPAAVDWKINDATATLSVSNNSQVQAAGAVVNVDLAGTLEVAGTISTNGDATNVKLFGKAASGAGDPRINVLENCTFTGTGGTATPANDIFQTPTAADDYKVTKLGAGSLTLVGAGKGKKGYGLGNKIARVYLQDGNLTFTRGGGAAAFAPANVADNTLKTTLFEVTSGHLTFSNAMAVETRLDPSQVNRVELRLHGGKATVNKQSIGNSGNVLPALDDTPGSANYTNEVYPGAAKLVNFPFPTRALIGKGATLEVKGDQAFQKISGMSRTNVGSIVINSGANLILTDQGKEYVDNLDADCYFYGSVSGAGGVAFANREVEVFSNPEVAVMSQIYPFVGRDNDDKALNTYTGDTIVYGKQGVLTLCENSDLGASTLYLRSVKPGKNSGKPTDRVGCLHVTRRAGPSKNVPNLHLTRMKIDGSSVAACAAQIEIDGPGAPDDNDSFEDYLTNNRYPHVLVVDTVVYDANQSEFSAANYTGVYALTKTGKGTLFINGAGEGGNPNFNEAVNVREGMLWLWAQTNDVIGKNQIRVAGDATLRVRNGVTLPADITLEDETSNFVTEVVAGNFNNETASTYAVEVNGQIRRGTGSPYGGVDLGGVIVWDTDNPFLSGHGYKVLKHDTTKGTLHDRFDAQTITQNHGINRPFLTGWMEKPGQGLNFGTQRDVAAPVLSDLKIIRQMAANSVFEAEIEVLHTESYKDAYGVPGVHLLVGGMGSFGASFKNNDRKSNIIVVRANVNPNPKENYAIFTVYLPWNGTNKLFAGLHGLKALGTQRTYKVDFSSGGGDTPPVVETVESKSVLAIDSASMSLAETEDMILRMAATDIGIDESGKITQIKDADGNMVAVTDVKVKIGSKEISNYKAELIGGAYRITVPAAEVPTGSNTVSLTGKLADGKTINTKSAGSVTKSAPTTPDTPTTPTTPTTPETPTTETPTTPSDDGGSSGGCDVGFGALSIAIAAAFLLRKKD